MSRFRLVVVGLAFILLAVPAAAAAAVQLRGVDATSYPTIRASIYTPTGGGRPALWENGTPVAGFQAQNLGSVKAIATLIDRSQSMRGRPLADAAAGARAFVAAKQSADELSVIAFGSKVSTLSPFSTVKLDADLPLGRMTTDSHKGTALYDAVIAAANQLKGNPLPGRVIIVLSDGADNASAGSLATAIKAAKEANASIYSIGIEGTGFTPDPLMQLSSATGGQYYGAASTSELGRIYGSIADALKKTWRVQYVTAARPGDNIRLTASIVGQGSTTQLAKIPVGDSITAPEPSKLLPGNAYGPGGPLAIAVAVAMLVLFGCLFFLAGIRGSWVRNRIVAHTGEGKVNAKKNRKERRSEAFSSVFAATEKALGHLKQWRAISRMLERADVQLRTVEFVWISVGAAVLMALLALLFGASAVILVALMVTAGLIPTAWVWLKMRKRLKAFEDELPDLLITIAASLKAGHSFKQGLQAVVDEGHPPANQEFKRVLTEASLGRPIDDALLEMADRMASKNFEFAITAVTIQRQVGGSLATLFDMVADTVRQRQQFTRKIRALTAMGRMSAYTLIGIPFFLAGIITLVNRNYMHPLYYSHTGHIVMIIGLVMMGIGSLILKKIVSFRG
ncbi:MAG TPA: type II secretion system F family protein [Gaiellaceae bacterium]|nr:type II secretion system F family protein [Gaiellaceae bacterium]